jgi:hypothetical protein
MKGQRAMVTFIVKQSVWLFFYLFTETICGIIKKDEVVCTNFAQAFRNKTSLFKNRDIIIYRFVFCKLAFTVNFIFLGGRNNVSRGRNRKQEQN